MPASTRRGKDAVAAIRASYLGTRAPPVPSAESLQAIAQTAAALADIRSMQGPGVKRDHRTERPRYEPSQESDAAHLVWQMRRALLCRRWGVIPVLGAPAASEGDYCNAVCGAALAQGGVDEAVSPTTTRRGSANDVVPDDEWQLHLLHSLAPESAATAAAALGECSLKAHLAQLLAFVRGQSSVLAKSSSLMRPVSGTQPAMTMAATRRNHSLPWDVIADLRADVALQREVQSAMRFPGLPALLHGLPASINASTLDSKPAQTLSDCRPGKLSAASSVFRDLRVPKEFAEVIAVVTALRVSTGKYVCIVHDLHGAPVLISNGARESVQGAFDHLLKGQRCTVIQNGRPGRLAAGDGVNESDLGFKHSRHIDRHSYPEWHAKLCGAANAVRASLIRAGAETVAPRSFYDLGNLRLLVLAASVAIHKRLSLDDTEGVTPLNRAVPLFDQRPPTGP